MLFVDWGVVVCVSVGIEFKPSLPTLKWHVWRRMPTGYVTKIVVTYKKVTGQRHIAQ